MISNGSIGSTPCAMKKGEWPVDLRVVAWSAQNAKGVTIGQLESLPLHALKMDLWIVQCCRSTMPFTCKLYAEMCMCQIPYLSYSQSSAATYAVPLSVMISSTAPYRHRISLKMKALIVRPVLTQRACHSGHAVSEHRACVMYLYPPACGMNIVSMYALQKSGAGVSTMGGSRIFVV